MYCFWYSTPKDNKKKYMFRFDWNRQKNYRVVYCQELFFFVIVLECEYYICVHSIIGLLCVIHIVNK
jgi:hypothetical protein